MKRRLSKHKPVKLVCAALIAFVMLLFCGLSAFAAEGGSSGSQQPISTAITAVPPQPNHEDTTETPYPANVQTVITDTGRQIVKTYILAVDQSPADIPRDGFIRDDWQYELTDITENRTIGTDTKSHSETAEISTDTNDLNEIVKLLTPVLEYQGDDGYCGLLALDLSSVTCEAAGYKNGSYTVTATREYPHLSTNDLALIPKTITDNGKTLELDSVAWEAQRYIYVDYEDIPESYRAIAKYTAKGSRKTVSGYTTTAVYHGEVSRAVIGDTVYTVYFSGSELAHTPILTDPPPLAEPATSSSIQVATTENPGGTFPTKLILICLAVVIALLAGAGAYWFMMRHNVKVYRISEDNRLLVAKDKVSAKKPSVDLSPLDGDCFVVEVDKSAAKALNDCVIEVRKGPSTLEHKIAFEGNAYIIEIDFSAGTIQAIY